MNEIEKIKNQLIKADQLYHNSNGDITLMDDSVYDALRNRLKSLSPDDPYLSRIGAPIPKTNALQEVWHKHPMDSLENAMNKEEFIDWVTNRGKRISLSDPHFNVSFKMDGGSMSIFYKDGYYTQAVSRGDGLSGEDLTSNAILFQGVNNYVELPDGTPCTGYARGEVMLFDEDWLKIDPDQLSNPRNKGNGIMRRKDGEESELLRFIAFRLFDESGRPFGFTEQTESDMLKTLRKMGFITVNHWSDLSTQEVLNTYDTINGDVRDTLGFQIDGLVVKLESFLHQKTLGSSSNCPNSMIAFKFPARKDQTKLIDYELTLGHTGAIIPTAILEPVKIGGVIVKRALLCNWQEIERLDVAVGDIVEVVRCGDVIPKITQVIERPADRKPIEKPTVCPVTGGPVGHKTNLDGTETATLFSLSKNNPAVLKGKILKWISSLDIQGLGEVFVDKLFEAKVINAPSDLYILKNSEKREALVKVLGESRAGKVLSEIERKRNLTISEFFGSMGIEGLGKRRVLLVQEAMPKTFDEIDNWTSGNLVLYANLVNLPGMAAKIQQGIDDNKPEILALLENGVRVVIDKPKVQTEGALTFCITGSLSKSKDYFHDLMTQKGHNFVTSYKKGISFLVAADPGSGSTKLVKAAKDGVKVISEKDLMILLQQ